MGEMVEFKSNGGMTEGYLAAPDGDKKAPGVVVIQEWWGLNDQIKGIADALAAEGFVALAPDLYHGALTKSPDEAGKLMMALNVDQAEKDLRGAIQFLLQHERAAGGKVGTVGFCMGGALSLYAASKNTQVGACVVFYGVHPNIKPDLENLQAPLLGIYGDKDTFVPVQGVRELEAKLKSLGKVVDIHIYQDAGHAFFNEQNTQGYNAEYAADAWRRTTEFFHTNLKGE
ncbi:MAG: dienelactone hydrolase family protein [Pyrinomonadaceae bacterium]